MTPSVDTPDRTARLSTLLAALLLLAAVASAGRAQADGPDQDLWDGLLREFASPRGLRFDALAADPQARSALDRYRRQLATMPQDAPLSAWLNAYNATVVGAIVERYPIESVMKVDGFFKKLKYRVAGKARSLDEIEHDVIRKRFADARIHVALNCGARSCPTLHGRAFREPGLSATLDGLARKMATDSRHARLAADGSVEASALLTWFAADFTRDYGSPLGFLKKYDSKRFAVLPDSTKVGQLDYDWTLNRAK